MNIGKSGVLVHVPRAAFSDARRGAGTDVFPIFSEWCAACYGPGLRELTSGLVAVGRAALAGVGCGLPDEDAVLVYCAADELDMGDVVSLGESVPEAGH